MLMFGSLAFADTLQDSITADTGPVSLVAGSSASGNASIRVVANSAAGDPDPGCNFDSSTEKLTLDVITPQGVTATPDPLVVTSCGTDYAVAFKAASGAVSGTATVSITSNTTGGTFVNQVDIPITVTHPNTKPAVSVSGVEDGKNYEIGHVPEATCDVTDAEDGNSTKAAVLSGTLSHGLGSQTATCDYTDGGGLKADTKSVTYKIVDTGNPTIDHTLDPAAANSNGWYKTNVEVDFTCADVGGSGIATCEGDTTLTEGTDQSATGKATDWAGNTATDTVSGINIDKTAPTVGFNGGPAATYYFGNDPAAPTCVGSDALSGVASCVISGGGTSVGTHSYTAKAVDKAGNEATATLNYEVLAWTTKGYYAPVDMGGVFNSIKGGSSVPLKFEVFAGSTELTSTSTVKSFTQKYISCTSSQGVDEIEIVTTGGTSLRYDATAGQFIQNWQTPKKPGTCMQVTVTMQDGTAISANFMLK
jgi:hypothetical protein